MIRLPAPASKSISHRLLIAASLADGESLLRHILDSRDLERTRDLLQKAGARMENVAPGVWKVRGMAGPPQGGTPEAPLDCFVDESGTTCRLLCAILAAGHGSFRIHGAGRMHERPLAALTDALSALGADIAFESRTGFPPLLLHAHGLRGGDVTLSLDESSQYLSGLLLAAPLGSAPLRISLAGEKPVSWPYIGLTLQTLEDFGISFKTERLENGAWQECAWREIACVRPRELRITVYPGAYRAADRAAEGDWSGASCLLAAGAVGQEAVLVTGLRTDSLQGDRAMLDLLRAMGAKIDVRDDGILVSPSRLSGIEANMGNCPDLVPAVAMTAAFAEGTTHLHDIAHLRLKECDRLSACASELSRIGVKAEETADSLIIHGLGPARPRVPAGTVFCTYGDHRMAMACALLGLVPENDIVLDDVSVVDKSFPDFWEQWKKLAPGRVLD